jgi:hypothetical protein
MRLIDYYQQMGKRLLVLIERMHRCLHQVDTIMYFYLHPTQEIFTVFFCVLHKNTRPKQHLFGHSEKSLLVCCSCAFLVPHRLPHLPQVRQKKIQQLALTMRPARAVSAARTSQTPRVIYRCTAHLCPS